ncbi:hypothetical protein CAPTEDRAFT_219797 [Capitella teleta]|uniref:CTCK domain-containing protein n=1 Tax=Capitella teleta TaxID=283909 RepID=R7V325_CAPTE|nr:hypothetical protein CAPTEDRAFT_219797 [Capitella teleta]|eukprot:ELU12969.1 hypothetical protein CAPTEDRAFT_219797 [Capitella teleta]
MSSPSRIPEDSLRTEPATENVSDLRPGSLKPWTADSNSNPAIFVTLVEDEEEPIAVGSVVLEGNAQEAEIFFKPSLNDDNQAFKPISVNDNNEPETFKTTTAGRLVVTLPNKVFAAILKIVPLAPADQADAFVINNLQIFACFEEETTTTTTTPAGTTTVTSTTRVTPTVTITTTTKTTPAGRLVVTLPNKVFAAILKIVPLAPADQADAFVINDLQIFACFEEETTTTTTTPAGTTTVTSTTRVTPTVTITTTTKTTPVPDTTTIAPVITTTTAAPVTTAAPATTTTTEAAPTADQCTLIEGMSSPSRIPEDSLRTEPATENVSDLRPGSLKPWTADSNSNPAIFVTLVEDEEEPIAVGSVVLEGNAQEAEIFFKPSLNDDNQAFKPISVNDNNEPETFKTTTAGRLVVTLPNKVFAAILKIVPLAPADQADAFVINDLQIFACFEEETTTTTTTPAGTTTVRSTTRVTPSGTTSVITRTTLNEPATTPSGPLSPRFEGCDEIMTDPVLFPDKYLEFTGPVQRGSTVSDVRPLGLSQWKAIIPDDETSEKPALKITLPSSGPVEKIDLLGTWKDVEIALENDEITFKANVQNNGQSIVIADLRSDNSKPPTLVNTITITIMAAQEGTTATCVVKVWACVSYPYDSDTTGKPTEAPFIRTTAGTTERISTTITSTTTAGIPSTTANETPRGSPTPGSGPSPITAGCKELMKDSVEIEDIKASGSLRASRPQDALPGDDKKWRSSLRGKRPSSLTVTLVSEELTEAITLIGTVSEAEITLVGKYSDDDATPSTFTTVVDTRAAVILDALNENGVSAPKLLSTITIKPLKSTNGKTAVAIDVQIIICPTEVTETTSQTTAGTTGLTGSPTPEEGEVTSGTTLGQTEPDTGLTGSPTPEEGEVAIGTTLGPDTGLTGGPTPEEGEIAQGATLVPDAATGSPTPDYGTVTEPDQGRQCPMVMDDASALPDAAFTATGIFIGKPSNVRPNDNTPLFFVLPDGTDAEKPSVTITLPDSVAADHFPYVEKIVIMGTVTEYQLQIVGESRETGQPETFTITRSNNGLPVFLTELKTEAGEESPVFVESITIIILQGTRDENMRVSLDAEVFACIEQEEPEIPHKDHGSKCQEVMADDLLIPDFLFKASGTILGRASDIRAGGKPLLVEIPEDVTQKKPSVTISLPDDPRSGHLPVVERITLMGTFDEINLHLVGENRETGTMEPFTTTVKNDGKSIALAKLRSEDNRRAPRNLESVKVTILSGREGNVVEVEMKMIACITYKGPGFSQETGRPTPSPFVEPTPAPGTQPENIGTTFEEIIHNDALVPASNLKTSGQVAGVPSDARPGDDKHLIMQIPRDPASERPSLTVTLPDDPASYHLTRVQMIKILGNFMLAELQLVGESRESGLVETFSTTILNDKKPIVLDNLLVLGGVPAPIYIERITVTIISGMESNKVTLDLEVYAHIDRTVDDGTGVTGKPSPAPEFDDTPDEGVTQSPDAGVTQNLNAERPTCQFGNMMLPSGTRVPMPGGSCVACTCDAEKGLVCEDLSKKCNLKCDGELVHVPGECCPVCRGKKSGCMGSKQMVKLNIDGCVSKQLVEKTSCGGSCDSGARSIFQAPFLETSCKCCKPTGLERINVQLKCANGTSVDHEYVRIKSCGCESCHFNPFELLQGEIRRDDIATPTKGDTRRQRMIRRLRESRKLRGIKKIVGGKTGRRGNKGRKGRKGLRTALRRIAKA